MEFVPDASSLIILDELRLLDILSKLREEIVVLSEVVDEIESQSLRNWVNKGNTRVSTLANAEHKISPELAFGLGNGETSVLNYCVGRATRVAVIDDRAARRAARTAAVRVVGTARLIKHLADQGHIDLDRAEGLIRSLPARGFFITNAAIDEVLKSPPL